MQITIARKGLTLDELSNNLGGLLLGHLCEQLRMSEAIEVVSRVIVCIDKGGETNIVFNGPEHLISVVGDAVSASLHDLVVKQNSSDGDSQSLSRAPAVDNSLQLSEQSLPPQLGERLLLLILRTKEERVNIPGDLEEEYRGIATKHGARYAKLWYYKQVAASAWPMIRKAVGWGLVASTVAWIRGRV